MTMKLKWMLSDEATGAEQPGSTAGSDAAAGLDVNWDALDREITAMDDATDDVGSSVDAPTEPTPAPSVEPTPVPATATPPQPALLESPQPSAPEVTPVEEFQPSAPTEPQVSREHMRAQYGNELAQRYALSEDDARALLTEPETVLPKLAARVHLDVVDAVMGAVMTQMPQIITSIQQQNRVGSEAEAEFFGAWPQLKDPKFSRAVYTSVASYRALNPKASRAEVVRAAGLNAMLSLRLPLPQELLNMDVPAVGSAAVPFVPAAPGSGGLPQPTRPTNMNPFVALSEDFVHEDRGG